MNGFLLTFALIVIAFAFCHIADENVPAAQRAWWGVTAAGAALLVAGVIAVTAAGGAQ